MQPKGESMFSNIPYQEVKQKVNQALMADSGENPSALATRWGLSEGAITLALPEELMSKTEGKHAETILKLLPTWGTVTTIVHSFGSIFEFKNPFPKGQVSHGYYNIMGKEGLHGHLRIDLIEHIAFVSKPFRDVESHYIGFYNATGDCIFKVYLGRDKKRQLLPEQIIKFQALKEEYCA